MKSLVKETAGRRLYPASFKEANESYPVRKDKLKIVIKQVAIQILCNKKEERANIWT
jgi:hypothetical protein